VVGVVFANARLRVVHADDETLDLARMDCIDPPSARRASLSGMKDVGRRRDFARHEDTSRKVARQCSVSAAVNDKVR